MKKKFLKKSVPGKRKNFVYFIVITIVIVAFPLTYFVANSRIGEQTNNNSKADSAQPALNTSFCKQKGCYWIIGNITPYSGNPQTITWHMKVIIDGTKQNHEGNVVCSISDGKGLFNQIIGTRNFNSLPFIWNSQFHVTDSKNVNGMYTQCKAVVNADNSHGFSWNSNFITFTQ